MRIGRSRGLVRRCSSHAKLAHIGPRLPNVRERADTKGARLPHLWAADPDVVSSVAPPPDPSAASASNQGPPVSAPGNPAWRRPGRIGAPSAILVILALVIAVGSGAVIALTNRSSPPPQAFRVLAYYYIWYDRGSWDRAKTDEPLLGAYSSDSRRVMEQHIEWAKRAGIDGFIVSWKSTDKLDRRLQQLVDVAAENTFKLAIIYQGLNFNRDPIPVTQVNRDLTKFAQTYAANPVFDIGGKPIVIWSGTWGFSRADISAVTAGLRQRIRILASERDIDGLNRVGDIVDGDAYYWSSLDSNAPDYLDKLTAMGAVVHANSGLWIAPVAAGFDARLVGGSRVISRDDGDHLRRQMAVIGEAHPDAIGIISWNEFSENSHIEPSVDHGYAYVDVVRDARGLAGLPEVESDSSEDPITPDSAFPERLLALLVLVLVPIVSLIAVLRRARRSS
jgi:hypothetical protein